MSMPTYDYECRTCGHGFDVFQNMSEPALSVCPACKKRQLRRLIGGGIGVIFKGSGFYVNDSRSKSNSTTGPVTPKDGATKPAEAPTGDSKSGSNGTQTATDSKLSGESKPAGDTKSTGKESVSASSGNRKKGAAAT
jgi:putative FmdB family regulatory protein